MTRQTPLIVDARLARPRPTGVVERPRLLDLLRAGVEGHRLTLVTAGAGYGKTTLLAELARRNPASIAWYSLGVEDAEITAFLAHVAAALRGVRRHYGRSLRALLREGAIEPRRAATAAGVLLNDLHRIHDPVLFILDDFHLVAGSEAIGRLLAQVLEGNEGPVRFIIASRHDPPLPLARLRARRQLCEIGSSDLAFTHDELRKFLEVVHHRPTNEAELEFLARSTEGWITPVQLALQATHDRTGPDLARALERAMASGASLHDYLADEILSGEPAERRSWMLRTSPFDEIEPSLLAAVFAERDPEERIGELVRRGLLHAFEGADASVYRYHVLLRDLLRRRFAAEIPVAEQERIHREAARWHLSRGELIQAGRHLAALADRTELIDLLHRRGVEIVDTGQSEALVRLYGAVPADLLLGDPWLRLRLADARQFLGEYEAAELDYEWGRARFRERNDLSGEAWCGLGLARIRNLRGQAVQAARDGEDLLARLDQTGSTDEDLLARWLKVLSGAYFYSGRYSDALRLLDRLEELSQGDAGRQAGIWNNRAVLHASRGNYREAARAFEQGLSRPGSRRSPHAPLHLANLALLLTETGDWERAGRLFEEAKRLAERFCNRSQILSALIGQAHLSHRLGDAEGCLERLRQVEERNAELRLPLIEADALALRARLMLDAGRLVSARELLARALTAHGESTGDANALLYRIEAAVIELRDDRLDEARDRLRELEPLADALEADFLRMRVELHLGEAALRLGETAEADSRLGRALTLGLSRGHETFLLNEMRREPAPFLFLLERGTALKEVSRLLTRIGAPMEGVLLDLVNRDGLPAESVSALLGVFAEIGGPAAHRRISAAKGIAAGAARPALASIERRHPALAATRLKGPGLSITTLGRLRLASSHGELSPEGWRSQRALSIFLYLALRGERGVTRDRLVEIFWPGGQTRRAEVNFHPTLSYVRRALRESVPGPVIVSGGGLFRLDPDLPLDIDARRFEALASDARSGSSQKERRKALEGAMALYQGDFLEDFPDSWADGIRRRLGDQYEGILETLGKSLEEEGDRGGAADLYRRLLERSPYREDVWVRLLSCYHFLGDRQSVREQWARMVRLLKDDLGVDPDPETVGAYQKLTPAS